MTPKILAFAGATRTESFNKKLIRVVVEGAKAAGADVTLVDLRDYPMPLYDGDLEASEGVPKFGMEMKRLFLDHQGLLLSCPEYNSSITGVLKNTIDWVSRPVPNEKPLECFKGKVCGLVSASPGALGGLRGLVTVRSILGNIGVIVLPEQVAVSHADQAFDADGKLKDAKQDAAVKRVGSNVAEMLAKLSH